MRKPVITTQQEEYIREHYRVMSANDMARVLGISSTAVCRYMRDNGLKISKKRMNELRTEKLRGRTKLTAAQQQVI